MIAPRPAEQRAALVAELDQRLGSVLVTPRKAKARAWRKPWYVLERIRLEIKHSEGRNGKHKFRVIDFQSDEWVDEELGKALLR